MRMSRERNYSRIRCPYYHQKKKRKTKQTSSCQVNSQLRRINSKVYFNINADTFFIRPIRLLLLKLSTRFLLYNTALFATFWQITTVIKLTLREVMQRQLMTEWQKHKTMWSKILQNRFAKYKFSMSQISVISATHNIIWSRYMCMKLEAVTMKKNGGMQERPSLDNNDSLIWESRE